MRRIMKWLNERTTKTDDQPTDNVPVDDVVMPDIYADADEPTVPNLKVLDMASPDIDKSEGFDPYDTAKLVKK